MNEVRCCVCGDAGVGKSSLLKRYVDNKFDLHIESTIGAAYRCRVLQPPGCPPCKLHLWDTAGQERFAPLCPMYLRRADIVLVALEAERLERPHPRAAVERWVAQCREASPAAVLVLVATKADLLQSPGLYRVRGALADLAAALGARHHHVVSSKTREGFDALWDDVETVALDLAPSRPPGDHLRIPPAEEGPFRWCC